MVFFALFSVYVNGVYENINPFLYIILLMYYYYDPIVKSRALRGLSRKSAIWVIHHRIIMYILCTLTWDRVISKLFKSAIPGVV